VVPRRILLVTPTSQPSEEVQPDVQIDLDRMTRRGLDVAYRTTAAGPSEVRSAEDAAQAAPHVVALICAAEAEGFDAVIVDCTDDPGVAEARGVVSIPVVGPGAALRDAARRAPQPVVELLGDDLRSRSFTELASIVGDAPTIAIVGTGHSALAGRLADLPHHPTVLEPLAVALDECLAALERRSRHDQEPADPSG
jgi:hypothetical protein